MAYNYDIIHLHTMSATVLFVILLTVFAVFMVYSAVLLFHWFNYAMNTWAVLVASVIYFGFALLILFVMVSALTSLL